MKIDWKAFHLYSRAIGVIAFAASAALANAVMAVCLGGVVMVTLGPKLGLVTGVWLMATGALTQSLLVKKLRDYLFSEYVNQLEK